MTVMRQGRWLNRFMRGRRPDRNPLRRTSDRVETYLLGGLLAAGIAGAPFAAQAAGHVTYAALLRAEHAQRATRHQVRAELLESAGNTTSVNGYEFDIRVPVQARWTTVTGAARTGQLMVPAGSPRGATVTVWTDSSGGLVDPPLQPGQMADQADLAAAGAVTGIGILYLCETVIVRQVLNRRRMAAWDADWALTEPMWNRQRW
jgi:hypothetical protein